MFPLKTDAQFTPDQVLKTTAAMLFIAHVDVAGTAEEVAMIKEFYDGFQRSGRDGWPAFETIKPASPAAACFPDAEHREMLMATCMMTAFADGVMSADELQALKMMASGLNLTEERFEEILALVKDYMLMQLAGLPDAESIVKVARDLG